MIYYLKDGNKIQKGQFGWVSKIKDRMYRTITPRGYHIGQATKEFIKGDTRDMSKFAPLENEVWARYLGTKYEGSSNLEPAIYRPTKGGATYDDVVKLKDESQILSDNVLKQLLDNYKKTGKKSMLVKGNETGLGTYTISMGEDKKGKYISYYDDWDINPTRGISAKYNIPILNQIGDIVPGTHPFSVYGRRYYKNGGFIRRMQTASGGPIRLTPKMQKAKQALDFVKSYYNSEGFSERFHNLGNILQNFSNSPYNMNQYLPDTELRKFPLRLRSTVGDSNLKDNSNYSINDYRITVGDMDFNYLPEFRDYDSVVAHELGHTVDNSIDVYQGDVKRWKDLGFLSKEELKELSTPVEKQPLSPSYSDMYPVFRNSHAYKNFKNNYINTDKKEMYDKYNDFYYDYNHDGNPGESYADLMQLRYDMNRLGIFDSRKKGQKFTKEHLNKFRTKDKTNYRIFDNFSDNDIIWMMNNVAQVENRKDNKLLAKRGGKMNAIERYKQGSKIHIKKKNRGKFTAYCGGNVTSACIAKAKASGNPTLVKRATFAANARKWKHQKGGKLCLIPRN